MNKFYYVFVLLKVFSLLGCQVSDKEQLLDKSDGLEINAMTFNIRNGLAKDGDNHWEKRSHLVIGVIEDSNSDVIGLQEAFRFQLDAIKLGLPHYAEVGISRAGGMHDEYSAILFNSDRFVLDEKEFGTFWLSETPAFPSMHWGNNYLRICTWARLIDKTTGQAFYIYNTHLDHRSQPSREKSVRLITNKIQMRNHQDPVVLMGDFNAAEDNTAITYLLSKTLNASTSPIPMIDSYRVTHPDAETVGTFNGFRGEKAGAKIDYILVEPDVRILDADIIRTNTNGQYASDHFPVTARIQFVNEKLEFQN